MFSSSAVQSKAMRLVVLVAMISTVLFSAAVPASADPAPAAATTTSAVGGTNLAGVVPPGVCSVDARAIGGGGGAGFATGTFNPNTVDHRGGQGADISVTLDVAAGQTYDGTVGGQGIGGEGIFSPGGANGGGDGGFANGNFHYGASGGGFTDLSIGGAPILVAGGGGGSGGGHRGLGMEGGDAGLVSGLGIAGVLPAQDGEQGRDGSFFLTDGGTGGSTSVGIGGLNGAESGSDAVGRTGGAGGTDPSLDAGGGGGGGFFGGGGGAATSSNGGGGTRPTDDNSARGGSGGGGGSSWVTDTGVDGLATVPTLGTVQLAGAGGPGDAGGANNNGTDGLLELDWQECDYDLSIEKTASNTSPVAGETVTYTVVITNNGPDPMTQGDTVTIRDDVASLFTNPPTNVQATHTTVGAFAGLDQNGMGCTTISASPLEVDCSQAYSASAAAGSPAGGVRGLDVGGQITVTYDVLIDAADAGSGAITNTAETIDRLGPASDTADVTPARFETHIDIAKTAGAPVNNGDGTWDVTYQIVVENPVSVPTCANDGTDGCFLNPNTNVQVTDPLETVWGADAIVTASSTVDSGPCTAATTYTGAAPGNLLAGTDTILPGESCVITVTATLTTDADLAAPAPLDSATTNTATVVSTEVPAGESANADATLSENPSLDTVKTLTSGPTNMGDGTYELEYTIDVTNNGDVLLENIQVTDGLSDPTIFGNALSNASASVASGPCDVSNTFTGFAPDNELLDGDDILLVGESCQIVLTVTVTVDDDDPNAAQIDTDYTNTANASGASPAGGPAAASDTATTQFTEDPSIAVVKAITAGPTNNGDGTYDLTYQITVTNDGNVELDSVQLTDDLTAVYGAGLVSASATVVSGPCNENIAYTGGPAPADQLLSGTDVLPIPLGSCVIEVAVTVSSIAGAPVNTDVTNVVGASGDSPSGENVTATDDATTQLPENPSLDLVKSVSAGPTNNGDGTYSITYSLVATNNGDVLLNGVQVTDGLDAVFGGALVSASQNVLSGPCNANPGYSGGAAPADQLLVGTDVLLPAESCEIAIDVVVSTDDADPAAAPLDTDLVNQAGASATSPSGQGVADTSIATVELTENPAIDIDKNVTAGPTNNGDGTFTLTYTLDVANTGDVRLNGVQVTDDLDAVYGAGAFTVDNTSATAPCELGGSYDGSAADADLLDGDDVLEIGETCQIVIEITVDATAASVDLFTDYTNSAGVTGDSPAGETVSDDDPATTRFEEDAGISTIKEVVGTPVNNGDGTHTITYLITVQNIGDVLLNNVQATDGLESVFGTDLVSASVSTGLPCVANTGYTGTAAGSIDLLTAGQTLLPGEVCGINVEVTVNGDDLGPHSNTAAASGTSPTGSDVSDDDPADVTLTENPAIDVVKSVGFAPVSNDDGSFDMTWEVVVTNSGDVPLDNVQVTDDLSATYFDATSWTVTGASVDPLDSCTISTTPFDGSPNTELLTGTDSLAVGESCTISIDVTFTPGADLGPYTNDVAADGDSPAGQNVTDDSSADVTVTENPAIDLTKDVVAGPTNDGTGIFSITYELVSTNVGDVPLNGVQITDDLDATFASAASWSVTDVTSADCTVNFPGFDGLPLSEPNLLTGADTLAVGEDCVVQLTVEFDPDGVLGTYTNSATTEGASPGGEIVDDSASTDEVVEENPAIDVTKDVVDPPGIVNNQDGTYTVTYESTVTNTGDVRLDDVQITDDLTIAFAAATSFDVDPNVVTVTAGSCTANPNFDGSTDTGLLAGSDSLIVGESCTVEFPVTIENGNELRFTNDVIADGDSPAGENVTANDDVPIALPESPQVSIAKDLLDPPAVVSNNDGTYVLTYRLVASNTGDVPLSNAQVRDDLGATYADAISFEVLDVTIPATDPCTENPNYNGDADQNLLTGTDTWAVGDVCTIDIEVLVEPGTDLGPYDNNAIASGESPGGIGVTDISQDGNDPDPEGDGPLDNSDPTTAFFTEGPAIDLTKNIIDGPTNNGDGTYDVSYELVVVNSGDVILYGVQVEDDLSVAYDDATAFIVNDTRIDTGLCTANDDFDGNGASPTGDIDTLNGGDALAVGESCTIEIDVTFAPGADLGPYDNSADASGTSPGGTGVSDTDNADLTVTENPEIGLTKDIVAGPTSNGDGSFSLTYQMVVENTGDIVLTDVQVDDDLSVTYLAAAAWQVDAHRVTDGACDPALTYTGAPTTTGLLDGNDILFVGDTCTIEIDVTVTPGAFLGDYDNNATAEGTSPAGTDVDDISQDGADNDPNSNGPGDNSDPTPVSFTESPAIELIKQVVDGPTNDGTGVFTVVYELVSTNTGDVPLNGVQITDDLDVTFAGVNSYTATDVASPDCSANFPGFDGSADQNLLDGSDTLGIGESCTVQLTVEFDPGANLGTYTNAATTEGTSPAGEAVNDDASTDEEIVENPAIALDKSVTAGPTNDGTGTFNISYELVSTNTGDVPLNGVQITDDLDITFAGVNSYTVTNVTSADCSANFPGFDGSADQNLLTGTDTLAVGEFCTVIVDVEFDPGANLGTYTNAARTEGTSPAGESVDDVASTDETVTENPAIEVVKTLVDPPGAVNNGDGTYDVTWSSTVTNTGDVPLFGVQVDDDLSAAFGAAAVWDVDPGAVSVTAGPCTANGDFDGNVDPGLLEGGDTLAVGEFCTIEFTMVVTPGSLDYTNEVLATGTSPAGQGVDDRSEDDVTLPEAPAIELVKGLVDPPGAVNNGDGTYTVTWSLTATNTGNVPLNDVQIVDDMSATFADATAFDVIDTDVAAATGSCSLNLAYDGVGVDTVLDGTDTWAVGDSCTVEIEVLVTTGADLGAYTNTADATGTSPGGTDVNDADDAEVTMAEAPAIELTKDVVAGPTSNGDGSYTVVYELVTTNTGDVVLNNVQIDDDLSVAYADAATWQVDSWTVASGPCTAATLFNGSPATALLAGTDSLVVGASCAVQVEVTVTPGADLGPYTNTATTEGTSPAGAGVNDTDPADVTFVESPAIDLTKAVASEPVNDGTGIFTISYELVSTNTGDVPLNAVQITDDLDATFAGVNSYTVTDVTSVDCSANFPGFDGSADQTLLTGADTLDVGESCTVTVDIEFDPGAVLGTYTNVATTDGTSPAGEGVNDTASTDEEVSENPAIALTKEIVDGPTNDGTGIFTVVYELVSTNTGDVPLNNVQINDDLSVPYAGVASWAATSAVTDGVCVDNAAPFDGSAETGTLDGTTTLAVGESCTVEVTVIFEPGADLGPYENTATTEGTSPAGEGVDDDAPAVTSVEENPVIELAKDVIDGPTNDGTGIFTISYELVSTNTGDVPLNGVQITDDLDVTFGGTNSFAVTGVSSADCSANFPGFDGDTDINLLTGTDTLAVGESCTVIVDVEFDPGADLGTYTNVADTAGASPAGEGVTDTASTDEAVEENPAIEVVKTLVDPPGAVNNGDGTYDVTWSSTVTNTGDVPLLNVQVDDDLSTSFGAAAVWDVDPGAVSVTAGACIANGDFDGNVDTGLLEGGDTLAVGEFCTIEFTMTITPGAVDYTNEVLATGTSPAGEGVDDRSEDDVVLPENPAIELVKDLVDPPGAVNNGDGTYSLTWTLTATNTGDVPLNDVQIVDDMSATFADAAAFDVIDTDVAAATGSCSLNLTYDGVGVDTLLDGTDTWAVGDSCTVEIEVLVTTGADLGAYVNAADASGTSPGGTDVSDNDTADVTMAEAPAIELTKDVVAGPTSNGDGSYSVVYQLVTANTGDVILNNVQIDDDLSVAYADAAAWQVDSWTVASGPCTAATTFNGAALTGLLTGTDALAVGASCTVQVEVTVTPGADLGPYENTATTEGTSPAGAGVNDTDPADVTFVESPAIELTKAVSSEPVNDGTGVFTIGYQLVSTNTGDVPLSGVQITDNLDNTFAGVNSYTVTDVTSADCSANFPGFDGSADQNLLTGADTLDVGESCTVNVTVEFDPGAVLGAYTNVANTNGTSPAGEGVTDDASTDEAVTENPAITLTKEIVDGPTNDGTGVFTVVYELVSTNTGDVPLNAVQISDDLTGPYGDVATWSASSAVTDGICVDNAAPFDGAVEIGTLDGTTTLAVGDSCTVEVTVVFEPGADLGPYENTATTEGTSPAGEGVADEAPALANAEENPAIELEKEVVAGPTNDGTGIFTISYELVSTNTGDVPLNGVQITDDLDVTFGGTNSFAVTNVSSADCSANFPGFDGDTDINLLTGTDTLAVGETCTVIVDVEFDPGADLGTYTNVADTEGTSPAGESVGDTASTDEAVEENPAIEVVKTLVDPPGAVNNGDGTYDVTWSSTVTNTGDVPLLNVQVDDDLTAAFAAAAEWDVDPGAVTVTAGACTANSDFDGDDDTGLLEGDDTLAVGESCTIDFTMLVAAGDIEYTNDVEATGTSPAGEVVDDRSEADVELPENPEISIDKQVLDPPAAVNNADGTYTLTWRVAAVNSGDVPLNNVQIVDDMADTFGDALSFEVLDTDLAAGPCTLNGDYDGDDDENLLDGTDAWAVGEGCTVDIEVIVTTGADLGPYLNEATATGTSPGGVDVDATADAAVTMQEGPEISLNKRIIDGPTNNGDGTYDVTYELVVENTGDIVLSDVQVEDDMSVTYAPAIAWTVNDVRIDSGDCTTNDDYDGDGAAASGDVELLSGDDVLAVGDSCTIEIDVTFAPGSFLGSYDNSADASGTSPAGGIVTDISQDGDDADPEGDGPADNSDPTPLTVTENPEIALSKDIVAGPTSNGDGSFSLTYQLVTTNVGDIVLAGVQVDDDLSVTFDGVAAWNVDAHRVTAGDCDPAAVYTGSPTDIGLLDGNDRLAIGESCTIEIDVTVTPGADLGVHDNSATASGVSPSGANVDDVSQDGADSDPEGDGPGDNSDPTPVLFDETPVIELSKDIIDGPNSIGNGIYDLTYELVATNTGDVPLSAFQIVDDLAVTFADATSFAVDSSQVVVGTCTANPAPYDGGTDTNLLAGTDTLAIGDSCAVTIKVIVVPGADLGPYDNTATTSGVSPAGEAVNDVSQDGAETDPDGDGDASNNSDPTPAWFTEEPQISLSKDIVAGPTANGDGTYAVTYQMVVANSGDVDLSNVQVSDDLAVTYADAVSFAVDAWRVASGVCTPADAYDGETAIDLLAGTDTLVVSDTCTIEIDVTVEPGAELGPYDNNADAVGTSPSGAEVTDTSQDGTDADIDGDNDPGNNSDPTQAAFVENPELGLAKAITDGPDHRGNGVYDLTYTLVVGNIGEVVVHDLQVNDSLENTFANAENWNLADWRVVDGPCTASTTFDGNADVGLLAGTDTLEIGETCTIEIDVAVAARVNTASEFVNQATADAVSPAGSAVSDLSHNGLNPDPDANGSAEDNLDPTPFEVEPIQPDPVEEAAPSTPTVIIQQPAGPQAAVRDEPKEPLAFTGANSGLLVLIGMSLVVSGGALVFLGKRRKDDESTDLDWETLD